MSKKKTEAEKLAKQERERIKQLKAEHEERVAQEKLRKQKENRTWNKVHFTLFIIPLLVGLWASHYMVLKDDFAVSNGLCAPEECEDRTNMLFNVTFPYTVYVNNLLFTVFLGIVLNLFTLMVRFGP